MIRPKLEYAAAQSPHKKKESVDDTEKSSQELVTFSYRERSSDH